MSDFSWDLGRGENHLGHLKKIFKKENQSTSRIRQGAGHNEQWLWVPRLGPPITTKEHSMALNAQMCLNAHWCYSRRIMGGSRRHGDVGRSVLGSQDRSSPVPGVDSGPSGQGMCYHVVEHVTFCLETHFQCSKVLENYSKIVFGWKVRVLRSTSFWIPMCLCLHSSLKQVYRMAFFPVNLTSDIYFVYE